MTPTAILALVSLVISLLALSATITVRREGRELAALVRAGIGTNLSVDRPGLLDDATDDLQRLIQSDGTTIVLRVDGLCLACHEAVAALAELQPPATARLAIVAPSSYTPPVTIPRGITLVTDDDSFRRVPGPWLPTVLAINAKGEVVDAQPAANAEDLDRFISIVCAAKA